MLTEEQKAKIRARAKAQLAERCKKEEDLEEGVGGTLIGGAIGGTLGGVGGAIAGGIIGNKIGNKLTEEEMVEAITKESDLLMKLDPISENEIYDFMDNLKGGTYFNMGMYSSLPIAKLHKPNVRIYKVIEMSAIVSGVDYENIGTTKDFRDQTGKGPSGSWYDHQPGREHKVGVKRSNPEDKYILWQIRPNSGTNVRYFFVDFATDTVKKIEKADILASDWLTESEKKKLQPTPVTGYNLSTGELVENETVWRTAAFNHVFWLRQGGAAAREYGKYFEESFGLQEESNADLFFDAHAGQGEDLDALIASYVEEDHELALNF